MDQYDEAFTPETIDERIDQLLTSSQARQGNTPVQVVQTLRDIYEETSRVQRVWERLAPHIVEEQKRVGAGTTSPFQANREVVPGERKKQMQMDQPHPSRKTYRLKRPLQLLIASIVLIILVGSLATIMQFAHEQKTTPPASSSTTGTVVYSESLTAPVVSTPAWSPDSQRIATLGNPTIWDALTGQHRITISGISAYSTAPAWSPDGSLLALAGETGGTIVNGQNGNVIATYHIPGSQALSLTGSGGPLSAHIRQSGFAISGISWSPDGKAIVSCFSEGLIQVWNPQTGQPTETLHPQNGEGCTGVAWSPDGKYIAASMLGQILVWNAQTQQIIFQSTAPQAELFAGVSWQPGTDDLAASLEGTAISLEITPTPTPTSSTFNPTPTPTLPPTPTPTPAPGSTDHRSEMPSAGSTPTPTPTPVLTSGPDMLKIWSIPDGHLLKAITGISGNVTWSPDGKKIAYASQFAYGSPMTVAILDIASGQTTYTYHAPSAQIELGGLAWSPDGRYIAVIMTTPAAATATPSGAYSESLVAQIWMA